jgi:hypothetical protein
MYRNHITREEAENLVAEIEAEWLRIGAQVGRGNRTHLFFCFGFLYLNI